MHHFLSRTKTAVPGDHNAKTPADPRGGPDARATSLAPGVRVLIGPNRKHARGAPAWVVPFRITPLAVSVIALLWALSPGQALVPGSPAAPEDVCSSDHPVQIASTGRVGTGSPDSTGRLAKSWCLRPHKRSHVFPRFASGDDPNDNETSDDPNDDDDAWDDLSADDDTHTPIIVWPQDLVTSLIARESAPVTWSAPFFSPFLTLERLRC